MINRIRDIRRQKNLTLAEVAERCTPPTTAQTIGRLETGTRTLSLGWMNRIAAALGVEPQLLLRNEENEPVRFIARLGDAGADALASPADAILPTALGGDGRVVALRIDSSAGEYRSGDQLWLREVPANDLPRLLNRDVLVPRQGGHFAFGRLIDQGNGAVTVLPPGSGQRPIAIERPDWLAVAEMLVRPL